MASVNVCCAASKATEARGPDSLLGRGHMHVLLLSMPDSFQHMPSLAIRMPNGALTSLAGNLDAHHRVAVADLILVQSRVRETVERLVREFERRNGRMCEGPWRHSA